MKLPERPLEWTNPDCSRPIRLEMILKSKREGFGDELNWTV
jgi:hypothetical protein